MTILTDLVTELQ